MGRRRSIAGSRYTYRSDRRRRGSGESHRQAPAPARYRFGMTEPQPRPEFVIEFISPVDKSVVSRLYMGGAWGIKRTAAQEFGTARWHTLDRAYHPGRARVSARLRLPGDD